MKLPEQDKIATELYGAVAMQREQQPRRGYLGMSEVGHPCERKLWLSFRLMPAIPIDGRALMIFRFGDMIEEDIVSYLNLAGYRVEGQQDAFSDHDGWFSGHCDGIIHGVTQKPHILEIKSANDKKWKSFKGFGVQKTYQVYYDQAQCYMGYSGLDRALFVVQNKNDSSIYTERVYFNKDDFQALKDKAYRVITANQPIDPPFDEDNFNCRWCDYRVACRNQHEAPITQPDCRNCSRHFWDGLTKYCRHKDHPFKLVQRNGKCPDWKPIEYK